MDEGAPTVCLTAGDGVEEVVKVVRHLGYDLTEEDNARVYESFQRIAAKKHFVNTRELDAIVASSAMQVPSTGQPTGCVKKPPPASCRLPCQSIPLVNDLIKRADISANTRANNIGRDPVAGIELPVGAQLHQGGAHRGGG